MSNSPLLAISPLAFAILFCKLSADSEPLFCNLSSKTVKDRLFIAENTDQIYFVSNWVKNKFFEGLPYNYKNNCETLYPAIKPLIKFPKKENIIIFSGKLNSSKGFDLFGKAVIKILDRFPQWKAIAIGNEPREKFSFKHKNFKILDWIKHDDILKYYSRNSK